MCFIIVRRIGVYDVSMKEHDDMGTEVLDKLSSSKLKREMFDMQLSFTSLVRDFIGIQMNRFSYVKSFIARTKNSWIMCE